MEKRLTITEKDGFIQFDIDGFNNAEVIGLMEYYRQFMIQKLNQQAADYNEKQKDA